MKRICATCRFYEAGPETNRTSHEGARRYLHDESVGGICSRTETVLRQPQEACCALHRFPRESSFTLRPWKRLREMRELAQKALDSQAEMCDDRAVLRMVLSQALSSCLTARAEARLLSGDLQQLPRVSAATRHNLIRRLVKAHTPIARFLKTVRWTKELPPVQDLYHFWYDRLPDIHVPEWDLDPYDKRRDEGYTGDKS